MSGTFALLAMSITIGTLVMHLGYLEGGVMILLASWRKFVWIITMGAWPFALRMSLLAMIRFTNRLAMLRNVDRVRYGKIMMK